MTPELVGILSVGVAIVVLVVSMQRTDKRRALGGHAFSHRLESRMSDLEQRQARLEGLLDGLREALFERAARLGLRAPSVAWACTAAGVAPPVRPRRDPSM